MQRETGAQGDLIVTWIDLPRSLGHAFYDKLQKGAARRRFRCLRRGRMQALLRSADRRAVVATGPVFPYAHGRLFRKARQRTGHRVALRQFLFAARFPAAFDTGQNSRSLLTVEDALASPARSPREGFRRCLEACRRAGSCQE